MLTPRPCFINAPLPATPDPIQRQPRIRLCRSVGCAPSRGLPKAVGGGPYLARAEMMASATFFGASAYCLNSIVYVARPCVAERSEVE